MKASGIGGQPYKGFPGIVTILLIVSFVVKVPVLAIKWGVLTGDGIVYATIAKYFSNGDIKGALALSAETYLPFYSLLISVMHWIIDDWALASQMVSFLSGWLSVIPFYFLTKRIFDEKISIAASLFFIISPDINFISTGVGSDSTFLLLYLLAAWTLWLAYEKRKYWYMGIFIVTTLAALLTRSVGVALFPLFFFWMVHSLRKNPRRLLIFFVISITSLAITLVPVWLSYKHSGGIPGKLSAVVSILKDPSFLKAEVVAEELRASEKRVPGGKYFDFFEIARHYIHLIYLIGLIDIFIRACGYAVSPFLIIGFFRKKKPYSYGELYLLSIAFVFLAMNYVFLLKSNYIEPRYVIPGAVALFPWAGKGYFKMESYLMERFSIRRTAVVFVTGLILVGGTAYKYNSVSKNSLANVVEATRWVRDNLPSETTIVTNEPAVPFNADKPYIVVDCTDLKECMEEAQAKGAGYLIYKADTNSMLYGPSTPMKVFKGKKVNIFIFKVKR